MKSKNRSFISVSVKKRESSDERTARNEMRVRLTGLWQEIKILCTHHERKAHNFLRKMGSTKSIGASERATSKREQTGRAKSGQNPRFVRHFNTNI